MRGLFSDGRRSISLAQSLFELDAPSNNLSPTKFSVLGRLAMLLVIAFAFAVAAQLLVNSPF